MGGLVIKKAYILSRQIPEFETIAKRFLAIMFLGTPHQGADIVQTLRRLLSLVASRAFLDDLSPQSPILQAINEEFPRICAGLKLFSFFETKPMNYILGKGLIVEKQSAVLNYANERRTHLDANHRDVARYLTLSDPSFLTVRNALATLIAGERQGSLKLREHITASSRQDVGHFLGIQDVPEEDYMKRDSVRVPGSCEWLTQKRSFLEWQSATYNKFYWLSGRPGVGKSVLSSFVISRLHSQERDCCYFFFSRTEKSRNSINSFLRSMAYQMAILHPEILSNIMDIASEPVWKDTSIDKADYSPVWRKIFLAGILKTKLGRPQYWVIDAIDECKVSDELLALLLRVQEVWPLCIFVTCRKPLDAYPGISACKADVSTETVSEADSNADISLFVRSNLANLRSAPARMEAVVSQILDRSMGCFLWAYLVIKELRFAHTAAAIQRVLNTVPSDMDDLYQSILGQMANSPHDPILTSAILTWTVCAFRALTTRELADAIQIAIDDEIVDMEKLIDACCENLVFVDQYDKVQLLHLTVRDLLTRKSLESKFRVDISKSHQRLALVCLETLARGEANPSSKSPRKRRPGVRSSSDTGTSSSSTVKSSLTKYASEYLFQHLGNIHSSDYEDELFQALSNFFLSTSVLSWIEYMAARSDMQAIFNAGKTVASMIQRRTQRSPPLPIHKEISILDRWSNDLPNIVAKFGRRIRMFPSSIHHLVPPFCPLRSAIRQQFTAPLRSLSVQGLSTTEWDDCLSTITYPKLTRPSCVTVSAEFIAIGTSIGSIFVYDDETYQDRQALRHGEPVWSLEFGSTGNFLASAGAKSVKVWATETWTRAHTFTLSSLCLALCFSDEDTALFATLRSNHILCWDLVEGELIDEPVNWTSELENHPGELSYRQPAMTAFCAHLNLLAIVYRAEEIILWDIENQQIHDVVEHYNGPRALSGASLPGRSSPGSTASIHHVAFSAAIDTALLAVTYGDGDLYVYDLEQSGCTTYLTAVYAQILSSSADGRTLATADARGLIRLFDFTTLKPLYNLQFDSNAVGAKRLIFTADSLRLIELRGRQCRAWRPSVLLRQDIDDELSDSVSMSSVPLEVDYCITEPPIITAVCCAESTAIAFCGREDGSVHVHDATGEPQAFKLFARRDGSSISLLHFDSETGLLSSCDVLSRVACHKIKKTGRGKDVKWEASGAVLETKASAAVFQIMGSGRHSRLLISCQESEALWDIDEAKQFSAPISDLSRTKSPRSRRWASHPSDPRYLVYINGSTADMHDWKTLQLVSSCALPKLDPGTITHLACSPHRNLLTTVTVDAQVSSEAKVHSQKTIQVWDANDFSPGPDALFPICSWPASEIGLQEVIGIFNRRLVFLDDDYWVCSVPMNLDSVVSRSPEKKPTRPPLSPLTPAFDDSVGVVQHFFLPHDWITLAARLEMSMNKVGDIFFAKRSELAVIRKGHSVSRNTALDSKRLAGSSFTHPKRLMA